MVHSITLATGDSEIATNDVLGRLNYAAPGEAQTGDARLIGASITAVAEGAFTTSANATKLVFSTGASETAAEKMSLSSAGVLTLTGAIELGHASDTTLARASSGDLNVEGNLIYRAGGTDVPVADGGTGASTLTDGGILLGSGTGAITALAVLGDGVIVVGDNSTDPTTITAFTASDGVLKHEVGGLELDISGIAIGDVLAGTGTGAVGIVTSTGHADGQVLTLQADGTADWEAASGGGAIDISGTPVDNQLAVWTDADTLEGVSGLTFASNLLKPTASAHDAAGTALTVSAGSTTAGTTNNIAGAALTLTGGQGKGSGAGGDIIFQTANAGGSGSSINSLATALTISDDLSATFAGDVNVTEYIYHEGDTDTYIRMRPDKITIYAGNKSMMLIEEATNDKIQINSSGQDIDFRINGDNIDDLLSTDAANDRVGIACSHAPTALFDIANTLTYDGTTLLSSSTTDNTPPIVLLKHAFNDTTGSILKFVLDRGAAGTDGDVCGTITFFGDDDNQDNIEFARIEGVVADASNGTETGGLKFYVAENDGTNTAGLSLTGSTATDGEVDVTIGAGAASVVTIPGHIDLAGDVDVDGTLEADAITLGGTALGSLYSVIAGSSSIVTTGALDSGSITSGFGAIDNGSSAITTTGLISGGSLDIDDVLIDGSTIGCTGDTDLMTLASGGLTLAGTLTVGADDTGHDVKLFGATAGVYLLWDESADDLILKAADVDAHDPDVVSSIIIQDSDGNTEIAMDSSGTLVLGVNGDRQIRVDNQSGTNTAGSHLDMRAGKSTGTGVGGNIKMYTGTTGGGSGSSSNAHAIALTLDENQTAQVEAGVYIKEAANANADTADYGQLWVKNAAPNELYFTNDVGNDIQLTSGSSIKSAVDGSGAAGYLAVWSDADTLTYDNDANQHLFWDTATGELGIGTATPGSSLDVGGSVGYKPFMISSTSGEGDTDWTTLGVNTYEIGSAVTYLVETGDTARTIELPDPSSSIAGRTYTIKKIDSGTGTVTIQPYASGSPPAGGYLDGDSAAIDDGTNILFVQYDTISATCAEGNTSDQYEWHIVQEKVHPHCAKLEQQSDQTITKSVLTDVGMTHTIFSVGCSVVDPTNDYIMITRKGKYLVGGYIGMDDQNSTTKYIYLEIHHYDSSAATDIRYAGVTNTPSSSDHPRTTTETMLDLDVDDHVTLRVYHNDSSNEPTLSGGGTHNRAFLWVQEIK